VDSAEKRVHNLGVYQAVGMTSRQTSAMVPCWAIVPAIGAAIFVLPAGMAEAYASMSSATARSTTAIFGFPRVRCFLRW
jgi:TctA family transporter